MEVIRCEEHPHADALKIYEFSAPGIEPKQIVANLTNVYDVGNLVYVALDGTILKEDGVRIKTTNLRGINSFGMALGLAEGEPVGTDVSDRFADVEAEKRSHIPWPSIGHFHSLRKEVSKLGELKKITYRAKIKLDGSNASIQVFPNGDIVTQSRNKIIDVQNDNLGFAKWVDANQGYFAGLTLDKSFTIFGEFAGPGIQKRTAISLIDRRIFAVFAIRTEEALEVEPDIICSRLPEHDDVFVLPWYDKPIVVDFGDVNQVQVSLVKINKMVADIEPEDPWVKETFGVSGIGEGIVMYPFLEGATQLTNTDFTNYAFKAKGEKHNVVHTKQPAQLEPEVASSIDEFVKLFVTEPRLEQAVVTACNGEYDTKHIGTLLKWLVADIEKESKAEIAAAGLEFKSVRKALSNAGRKWYITKIGLVASYG